MPLQLRQDGLQYWQQTRILITEKGERDVEVAIAGFISVQLKLQASQGTARDFIWPQSIKKSKLFRVGGCHVGGSLL